MATSIKAIRDRRKAFRTHYKHFHEGNKCYYCGDLAETIDHVPAIKVAYSMGLEILEKRNIKLLKVRSCRQCNSILGDNSLLTLDDRARFVYEALQRRYKRLLQAQEWDREDIRELGPVLRSYVLSHHDAKSWIEHRLQYMEDLFYDVLADQD